MPGVVTGAGPGSRLYVSASDTTPNSFSFTDQTGVALSSTITSAAVTVAGLGSGVSIVYTASGGTIDKNGDNNFQTTQTLTNTDTFRARHTSSGSNSTATNTTVTGGGVSDIFTSTTLAASGALYYGGPTLGALTPTIYANTTLLGTGSGNSEANAMTLQSALAAATAGAIIGVLPGNYSKASGGSRFTPAWHTTNSGSSGNPIIIVAKYSAIDLGGVTDNGQWDNTARDAVLAHANRSELRHTGSFGSSGTGSPAFGASSRNYVHWIGFVVDETNANAVADTGPWVNVGSTGSGHSRCLIVGRPVDTAWASDNHTGSRNESSTNPFAYDNAITGFKFYNTNQDGGHNHCGMQRYDCEGTDFQHNFLWGNSTDIYLKDQEDAWDEFVHQNYCLNPSANGSNIEVLNTNEGAHSASETIVSQNLCIGGTVGLTAHDEGFNVKWRNNTVVGDFTGGGSAAISAHYTRTGGEINDNIFYCNSGSSFIDEQFRTIAVVPSNYNCCYSASGFSNRYNSNTYTSIASWRSATSQDNNSITSNPNFVGSGSYKLQGGSPALTGSSTSGPQGCYITGSEVIGPRYAP